MGESSHQPNPAQNKADTNLKSKETPTLYKMSGDSEQFIQTIGSVDKHDESIESVERHDQAELSDKIKGSGDKVPLGVLHDKLDDVKSKEEEAQDNDVTAHGQPSHPSTSSEPGVVGEIRTVGSAEPGAASSGEEEREHHR